MPAIDGAPFGRAFQHQQRVAKPRGSRLPTHLEDRLNSTPLFKAARNGLTQPYRLTGQSFLIFCPPRCSGVGDRRPAGVGRDAGGGARSCRRRTAVGTFPEGAACPRVPDELRGDRRWRETRRAKGSTKAGLCWGG